MPAEPFGEGWAACGSVAILQYDSDRAVIDLECWVHVRHWVPMSMEATALAAGIASLCLLLGLYGVSAQLQSVIAPAPSSSSSNWTGVEWPAGWSSYPSVTAPSFDYAEALHMAFIYLRIQRSGNLTASDHIAWRSNSCFTCTVGTGSRTGTFQ